MVKTKFTTKKPVKSSFLVGGIGRIIVVVSIKLVVVVVVVLANANTATAHTTIYRVS